MAPARAVEGAAGPWRVWVDTGGTFTDCVAVAPDGEVRRAKVLSSGALRGRVVERLGPRRLRIALAGTGAAGDEAGSAGGRSAGSGGDAVLPDGFCRGFRFALLDATAAASRGTAPGRAGAGAAAGGSDVGRRGTAVVAFDAASSVVTLAAAADAGPGSRCELRSPEEAPLLAARLVTATPPGKPLPPLAMRLATTRGTNALLERKGAPTALFITRGFADLLAIGNQQRPDLFALAVEKPPPYYVEVVEVDERLAADGSVLAPLTGADLAELKAAARRLHRRGVEAAAVALLHAYRNPAHEEAVAAALAGAGFAHVSRSAELAPLIGIVPRAATAVADAYLAPVIDDYLDRVAGVVGSLHVMTSAGGLVRRDDYRAKDSLLSGPAGGVVGAAGAGRRSGFSRVIGFDMGGTSTDVARYDGDFEYLFAHRVGDAELVAPALAIETVAAGGGSICGFDGVALAVGPASAGAYPGPACYGAGGPLTLTDVNLLLGRLDPPRFGIPVDEAAAEAAAEELLPEVETATGGPADRDGLLEGFLAIADERMAEAIRRVSVRRGYDPADYALVAFGGAGGQHACAVAAILGIATVLVPPDAGLLSAWGLGEAVLERFAHRQVLAPLADCGGDLAEWLSDLAAEAAAAVAAEGVPAGEIEVRRRIVHLRFVGQEATLAVELGATGPAREGAAGGVDAADIGGAFLAAYEERYGYRPSGRRIEVESLRVVASSRGRGAPPPVRRRGGEPRPHSAKPTGRRRARFAGRWRRVPVFDRESLAPGSRLAGPALVFERHSATAVAPGWRLGVDGAGALRMTAVTETGRFKKQESPQRRGGRSKRPVSVSAEERPRG